MRPAHELDILGLRLPRRVALPGVRRRGVLAMIPAQTNRAHLKARDPRCDTVTVLNIAARRRPGRRFADMNAIAGRAVDWNLHWPESMGKNGFVYIIDAHTHRRRRCTGAERAASPETLPSEAVRRYRKPVRRRGRPTRWERPYTVAERQQQAKRRRVVICWELKSRRYGTADAYAHRIVNACKATRWTAYFMALVTMALWGPKLAMVKQAGGETALLPHGARKTPTIAADLRRYAGAIDRIWGRWG